MFKWILLVALVGGDLSGNWTGPNGDIEIRQDGNRLDISKGGDWIMSGTILTNGQIMVCADYVASDGIVHHIGSYRVESDKIVGHFTDGSSELFNQDGTINLLPLGLMPDSWVRKK